MVPNSLVLLQPHQHNHQDRDHSCATASHVPTDTAPYRNPGKTHTQGCHCCTHQLRSIGHCHRVCTQAGHGHTCNPNMWEVNAGRLQLQVSLGYNKALCQKKKRGGSRKNQRNDRCTMINPGLSEYVCTPIHPQTKSHRKRGSSCKAPLMAFPSRTSSISSSQNDRGKKTQV